MNHTEVQKLILNEEDFEQVEKIVQAPNPTPMDQVLDTRSPQEIEAELVKQAEQASLDAAANMSPADRASMFFQAIYPQFEHKLHGLSKKELVRVCAAIVHYPIEEMLPKTDIGDHIFQMGTRLIDAKLIMRETIAMEHLEELREKEAQAKELADNATVTFEQGETVNE